MAPYQEVEFQTYDGVTLRGDLYLPEKPNAPLVILTHGLTLTKEQNLPPFGTAYASAGIAALIYDHRGYGASEGTPRNETNILQQSSDLHDAVTYARTLSPAIDPARIAAWGIGHSAGMSMIAAATDPRIKAAVIVMPFTSGARDSKNFPMDTITANRETRPGATEYIRPWPLTFEEATTKPPPTILTGKDVWEFIADSRLKTRARTGADHVNKLSLSSLYHIARVNPQDYLPHLGARPLLYQAAVVDTLTGPIEMHRAIFQTAQTEGAGPRELFEMQYPHLQNYFGVAFEKCVANQIEFLRKYL